MLEHEIKFKFLNPALNQENNYQNNLYFQAKLHLCKDLRLLSLFS